MEDKKSKSYTTTKRIVAGDTVYNLNITGDRFVLDRQYQGRHRDAEWTGTCSDKVFKFDQDIQEQLEIYASPENPNELLIKGKGGCLGQSIKEMKFLENDF